jgi:hypothetical protein
MNITDHPSNAPAHIIKDARVLVDREKCALAGPLLAVRSLTSRARRAASSCGLPLGTALRRIRPGLNPRLRLHVRIPLNKLKGGASSVKKYDTVGTEEYYTIIV